MGNAVASMDLKVSEEYEEEEERNDTLIKLTKLYSRMKGEH